MAFRRDAPRPSSVFTPGKLPLEEHNVYAQRRPAEKALSKYVERGQVPVIWGEYGVGKTTLARKYFESQEREGTLVHIPVSEELTLSDVFRNVLERFQYSVDVESKASETAKVEGGFDFKVVKATAGGSVGDEVKRQLVITSPTDLGMLQVLSDLKVTLVLDEMHKSSSEFRVGLANLIKAVKTSFTDFPQIVVIGTTTEASNLVQYDMGIDRYVKELGVPPMTKEEATYIVQEGFSRLGMRISDSLIERIVGAAAGAPTIVQALCLDAAESAIDDDRLEVTTADCSYAVKAYLNDHGKRLARAYMQAVETTGPKKLRKQILHAVANLDSDYATMNDIRLGVNAAVGSDTPSQTLSGPLGALKTGDYGQVLQDVERVVSGQRIHNLTTFTDPMMKSFVRFAGQLDHMGLMPAPQELPSSDDD